MSSTKIVESLFETAEAYVASTVKLTRLHMQDVTITVLAKLISRVSVACVVLFFIFILNIGLALWLGDLLGKAYFGFFIVAGFYLLAGIILHAYLYDWLKKSIGILIHNKLNQSLN